MKSIFKIVSILAISAMLFSSCVKDLDTVPLDKEEVTSASVFDNPAAYKEFLAKIYAGLALTGNQGPAGEQDIQGFDEGFSQYIRTYWNLQELPTDEAVVGWGDPGLPEMNLQTWSSSNLWISTMYYRIFYQIALCNEFIRQTTDTKLNDRGVSGQLRSDIGVYRSEVRFLRALSYYHALDLFGSVPFVTEDDKVGAFFPEQISKSSLFAYIESELKDIENTLKDPRTNEYARVDKAAAWTLLAKLYLNSEVYIGEDHYTDCITYCNKVINAGYSLEPVYANLFLADNDKRTNEIIFPVAFDGLHTQTYGGTNFIIHGAIGGNMTPGDFGVGGGWGGMRTTSAFVNLFPDPTGGSDQRAMFFTDGQSLDINDITLFTDGYAITKWKNVTSTGEAGKSPDYADTDFPLFRLADVYLMYAEAVLRGGGGGDMATAKSYVDMIRARAGNTDSYDLKLDFILYERGRELYWECYRRTDLVRFGKYTGGSYVWPWKGGSKNGTATDPHYNLFPIPAADITANPNLTQNPGY